MQGALLPVAQVPVLRNIRVPAQSIQRAIDALNALRSHPEMQLHGHAASCQRLHLAACAYLPACVSLL